MRKNACGLDRALRFVGAIALAAIALGTSGGLLDRDDDVALWQIAVAYAAGELAVSGLTQWCPGNYLLGRNTCANERSRLRSLADSVREHDPRDEPDVTDRVRALVPTL